MTRRRTKACDAERGHGFAFVSMSSSDTRAPHLDAMGWYCGNTNSTQVVGQEQAYAWGLYDTHGNVLEWCNDWCGSYEGDETDPVREPSQWLRVLRGAGRDLYVQQCRSASRFRDFPDLSWFYNGFHPVRSAF